MIKLRRLTQETEENVKKFYSVTHDREVRKVCGGEGRREERDNSVLFGMNSICGGNG